MAAPPNPCWRACLKRLTGQTANSCGKSEIKVSSPLNDPWSCRMVSTVGAPSGASNARRGFKKNYPRAKPRNPLISLDSDERIQGNPRKSNSRQLGFSQRNGRDPRKPKRTTGPASPAAETGPWPPIPAQSAPKGEPDPIRPPAAKAASCPARSRASRQAGIVIPH
jgi:hypothetical protein